MKTKKGISGIAMLFVIGTIAVILTAMFAFGGGASVKNGGANLNLSKSQILNDVDGLVKVINEHNSQFGAFPAYISTPWKTLGGSHHLNAFSDKLYKSDQTTKWRPDSLDSTGIYYITEKVIINYRPFTDATTGIKSYKFLMFLNGFSSDTVVKQSLGTDLCTAFKAKFGTTRVNCSLDNTSANASFANDNEINLTTETSFTSTGYVLVMNVVDVL